MYSKVGTDIGDALLEVAAGDWSSGEGDWLWPLLEEAASVFASIEWSASIMRVDVGTGM